MPIFALPLPKVDEWRRFAAELSGSRSREFRDLNRRYGLERHRAWLERAPGLGWVAIVEARGPGADRFLAELAGSDEPFDVWFRDRISFVHGIDFAHPPPLESELLVDGTWGAEESVSI
jgi:hypothetical protein